QLYQQFKLDEPWDSPNNKKLIERMPDIYKSPRAEAPPGQTFYKVFVGQRGVSPSPIFVPGQGRSSLIAITDGSSNTILAAEGCGPGRPPRGGRPGRPRPVPVRPEEAALRPEGDERRVPLHGRRAVPGGHVRPEAAPGEVPRQAVPGEGRADPVQQRRRHPGVA